MSDTALDVVALSRRYGALTAVDRISFTANAGDVIGLLGPNGAGKTTTIRLLTTMLEPTSGDFWVAGQHARQVTEIRRRIGVLPESSGYPRHQTGWDYLRYHARLHGLRRRVAEGVVDRLLAEVGLDERAGSPISHYSRGMRQRLGVARALVNDPAVIFLDEPTLGLDPASQVHVLGIIREIAKVRSATVLLSTHTLPEVEQVCSRVVILDRGRLVMSGSVGEVIEAAVVVRSARLRVPIDQVERARRAVAELSGLEVDEVQEQPALLRIVAGASPESPGTQDVMNAALVAVAAAGVPVLSYEVDGARLSEAFLRVTTEGK